MSSFVEPSPRYAPFSASTNGRLFVFGGYTKDFLRSDGTVSIYDVHMFDPVIESWQVRLPSTTRALPGVPNRYDGSCAASEDALYLYGGRGVAGVYGCLHKYDLATSDWTMLSDYGNKEMGKLGASMVCRGNELFLFGGVDASGVHYSTLFSCNVENGEAEKSLATTLLQLTLGR